MSHDTSHVIVVSNVLQHPWWYSGSD